MQLRKQGSLVLYKIHRKTYIKAMSYYREQLEAWISKLEIVGDVVIDVGGSQKPMTKRNIKKWEVKKYLILDNGTYPEGEGVVPDAFYDINYPLRMSNTYLGIPTEEDEDYGQDENGYLWEGLIRPSMADVVLCFEVMEYVWSPLQAHKNINTLLKDSGVAYISYPTIYPLHNPPGIDYLRYSKNAIEKLLTEAGFSSWEITRRVATQGARDLGNFYLNEGMRPMRNTDQIYDIGYMVKAYK